MNDEFSVPHLRLMTGSAFDVRMRSSQRKCALNVVAEHQSPSADRRMTAGAVRFAFIRELACVRVGMTIGTFPRGSFVPFRMAAGTFDKRMLPDELERGLGMVELDHFPRRGTVANFAASILHQPGELPFMMILVAGLARDVFQMKRPLTVYHMTVSARDGLMRSTQCKPSKVVPVEGKSRWRIRIFRVAFRTVVAVLFAELPLVLILVAVSARMLLQLEGGFEGGLFPALMALTAAQRSMLSVQGKRCERMVEVPA